VTLLEGKMFVPLQSEIVVDLQNLQIIVDQLTKWLVEDFHHPDFHFHFDPHHLQHEL
jgi:hypothetical protein